MPDTPTRLRVLVGLVALEALAMGALALVLAIGLLADRTSTQVGFVITEVVFAALVAAVLAWLASGLRRERRWAQGLGLTLQLFSLPFGVRLAQFGLWYAAIPVLLVVVAALVLLLGLQQPADPEPQGRGAQPQRDADHDVEGR